MSRTPVAKMGASMSTKQMARTVIDGAKVTITTATGEAVTGYLCGMDDFHWMLINEHGQRLLHKSAPLIEIGYKGSYDNENEINRDNMEPVIGPFRAYLQESGLVPTRPLSSVSATEGKTA